MYITKQFRGMMAAVTVGLFAIPAYAQTADKLPAPVIAVIDADFVASESLAGKGIVLEQAKYSETLKTFVTENETKLRAEEQALSKEQNLVAQDVFQKKVQDFQRKAQDLQGQVKQRGDQIAVASQLAQRELFTNIVLIGQEVAKQHGANIALPRTQLLFFEPSFDLSKQVLALLNQRVSSIKYQDPNALQVKYNEQGQIVDVSVNGQSIGAGAPGAAPAAAAKPAAPAKK